MSEKKWLIIIVAIPTVIIAVILGVKYRNYRTYLRHIEAKKEYDLERLAEFLEKHYGLTQDDYEVIEADQNEQGNKMNCVIRAGRKEFFAFKTWSGDERFDTSYYEDLFRSEITEHLKKIIDESGILEDADYEITEIESYSERLARNRYSHDGSFASAYILLPAWITPEEIKKIGTYDPNAEEPDKEYEEKWLKTQWVSCKIVVKSGGPSTVTEEQFESLRKPLFYMNQLEIVTPENTCRFKYADINK